jgi:hypothetical protein
MYSDLPHIVLYANDLTREKNLNGRVKTPLFVNNYVPA